jgi:hypothetical protein
MSDINTLGKTVSTGSDSSIGMPNQNDCPYEASSTGKMRRGKNPKVFDNNGGDSKAGSAGVVDHNAEYGPVTFGF